MGTDFKIRMKKKIWRRMVVTVAQQCVCIQCHWTVHLKLVSVVNFVLYIFSHDKNFKLKLKKETVIVKVHSH